MSCAVENKLALSMICALLFALIGCASNPGVSSGGNCSAGNCYNGHGTLVYANGGRYVGQWGNGMRNGQGTDYFANGDIYEGQFINDARSGYGKMTFANGTFYTGQWVNNKRNGHGRQVNSDGSIDEGNYTDDIMVRGKIKWPSGGSYTGFFNFKNGDPDGTGIYTDVNGVQWDQVWQNGKLVSSQERISSTSSRHSSNILPAGNVPPSPRPNTKINTAPDINFDEFTISPERAKVGDKFQLTVRFTASDPEKGANESLPITFHYEILKGKKKVFKSKPRNIESPNGHSTFKDFDIGAKKRGD